MTWSTLRRQLPQKLFSDDRVFRIASKFWWTDRVHDQECLCEECAGATLGNWAQQRRDEERRPFGQMELF